MESVGRCVLGCVGQCMCGCELRWGKGGVQIYGLGVLMF